MDLEATQRALQRHILKGDEAIVAEIASSPPISTEQRLKVYGEAYFSRLSAALRANFPALHFVLGDEDFDAMARDFTRCHPSATPSIRWFGKLLPDYLERAQPFCVQPVLAEISRFEWLLSEVFDAADANVIARPALTALDPNEWGAIRLRFHPSVRRTELRWNTAAIWHAAQAKQKTPDPVCAEIAGPWLLWRQELQNYFRSLDPREALAIDLALARTQFAEICEALATAMPEDEVPLYAATLLASWADSGLLTALD